jgi:hypothetical protein
LKEKTTVISSAHVAEIEKVVGRVPSRGEFLVIQQRLAEDREDYVAREAQFYDELATSSGLSLVRCFFWSLVAIAAFIGVYEVLVFGFLRVLNKK